MANPKRLNINDVAKAAGVSRQTVTRAMNDMDEISAKTKQRVLAAAEELGYRPSRFARNMRGQRHHTLGVMISTLRNPYFAELCAEIIDEATKRGWQTSITTWENGPESEVIPTLTGQVDLLMGYFQTPEEELLAVAAGVPIVVLEGQSSDSRLSAVYVDFEQGLGALVAEARQRGAKNLAMIDMLPGNWPNERHRVFAQLAEPGAPIVHAREAFDDAARAFARLMEAHPQVDTVIAFNDVIAIGALQEAQRLNLAVPGKVRIIGVDNLAMSSLVSPKLSTLEIDLGQVARLACEIGSEMLEGGAPRQVSVVPKPLWRGSA